MHFKSIVSHLVLAGLVSGHTIVTNIIIDDKNYGYGKCIRPYWEHPNYPVTDVTSSDLACRTSNMDPTATDTCPVKAGSVMTIEWHRNKSMNPDDVISASHTGSCLVYMAPMLPEGQTLEWFKIYEEGYNTDTKWCTDRLISNGGLLDVAIPGNLKAGDYVMRAEIIALHGARRVGGAQFFPNCIQLKVEGGGDAVPDGVEIPGYYKEDDPGIHYTKGKNDENYEIPGPAVVEGC
ncbi:hypothetical protein IWW40_002671 [Coemansia sp. RSA 1250]|nr:hypothetical protein IWW40_002671 [Coemansia sp. RSA 1250]